MQYCSYHYQLILTRGTQGGIRWYPTDLRGSQEVELNRLNRRIHLNKLND